MFAALLQAFANIDPSRAARRVGRSIVDFAIVGVCILVGVAFLIAAAFILVAERYGAVYACLGFGGLFIAVAIGVLIVHRIRSARDARAQKRRAKEAQAAQMTTMAGAAAMAVLPALLKGRGGLIQLALPLIAMAAYAIYKENSDRDGDAEQ
jgi:hypothetical protein